MWKISNTRKQKGRLNEITDFIGQGSERKAMEVSIPLNSDENIIKHAAAGLASDTVRSFEIWWDGARKKLRIVLVTLPDDAQIYKQAFLNLYPGAQVTPLEKPDPEFYDKTIPYKIFDVGYYHGHYAAVFKEDEAQWVLSNIANTIQSAQSAWIQVVFCKYDFTYFLNKHVNAIGAHHNRIQKNVAGGSILDGMKINFSGKPKPETKKEHPEASGDFQNNYSALQADATKKRQGPHAMVSIRGLIDTGTISDINVVNSISFEPVRCAYDYLTTFKYRHSSFFERNPDKAEYIMVEQQHTMKQRIDVFPFRLLPDARKFGYEIFDKYVHKGMMGGYKPRRSPPFIIALPNEMPTYIHLPKPSTPNISTTRGAVLPSQQINKSGFNLGYFDHQEDFDQEAYYRQFGREYVSSAIDAVTVSPNDFAHHIYAPGGTGSGKSSVIKVLLKHLEMSNIYGSLPQDIPVRMIPCNVETKKLLADLDQDKTLKELGLGWINACIYFDPKGDDSELFIRQCELVTLYGGNIHYLDPSKTNFTLNPLELPPYEEEDRDAIVDLYVGYFFDMIKGWYGNSDAFVRMNRILHNLLLYLYVGQDKPTFKDMYEMIQNIQTDESYLRVMYGALGEPGKELDMALQSIASMDAKSFEPVLNRLEKFVVSKKMSQMFCRRKSTINFRDLIKPGHYTVVRFSESDIALDKIGLAMQAFVMKLWFEVSFRSATVSIKDRTQVVLALDEFQKIKSIEVLETMISQARSKGLGLILAHQNLKQLDDKELSSITTNFGIQMAGHLEGNDAQRLAAAWDPKYVNEIKEKIATQPKYHWTARIAPEDGQEQPLPVQFWTHFDRVADEVCRSNISDEEWKKFIASEKERYKSDEEELSIFDAKSMEQNLWKKSIDAKLIPHDHWHIMTIMQHREFSLTTITELYNPQNKPVSGTRARGEIADILKEMIGAKLATQGEGREGKYHLTETAMNMFYFEPDEIGTAPDIKEAVRMVVHYYLKKGYFLAMAEQKIREGEYRTDMVAYDYTTDTPISVEIESEAEMDSHPEHVRLNMVKWEELGFRKCHMWSYSKKLETEYDNMKDGAVKKKTTVFIMDHEGDDLRIIPPEPEPEPEDEDEDDGTDKSGVGKPGTDGVQASDDSGTDGVQANVAAPNDDSGTDGMQPDDDQTKEKKSNIWTDGMQPTEPSRYDVATPDEPVDDAKHDTLQDAGKPNDEPPGNKALDDAEPNPWTDGMQPTEPSQYDVKPAGKPQPDDEQPSKDDEQLESIFDYTKKSHNRR